MRAMLLGSALLAAVAASAVPAGAQSWTSAGISSGSAFAGTSSSSVTPRHEGSGHAVATIERGRHDGHDRHHRRDRRRGRDFDGGVVFGDWDRDYQGDTLWRPSSFNDWWHERPNRSFPRWMQHNQNCERQWWGGGTWRC